jgi:hypothetical protein
MDVELLVIPWLPNTAATVDLLRQALRAVGLSGQCVRTIVVSDDNGHASVTSRLTNVPDQWRGPDPVALRQAFEAAVDTQPRYSPAQLWSGTSH